jgi:hypothetical protein
VPLVATDPGPFDVELRMDCGTNTGGSQGGVGSRNNCIVEDAAAPFSCKRTDITDRSFHFELEPK